LTEYRAYFLGEEEHITGFRAFVCDSDEDAAVWAKQLVDGHDVELWSGERMVERFRAGEKANGEAVSHAVNDGRMVPIQQKPGENE